MLGRELFEAPPTVGTYCRKQHLHRGGFTRGVHVKSKPVQVKEVDCRKGKDTAWVKSYTLRSDLQEGD